jgi:hypothetical protein
MPGICGMSALNREAGADSVIARKFPWERVE